jgi:hypothetical protein
VRLQKDKTKYFPKSKVYVVYLVISVVSKTGFGIFLAHLVCLKSEKSEMPENFQVHVSCLKDNSDPQLLKALKNCSMNSKLWIKSFLQIRVSWNLDKTISFRDFQDILKCKNVFITIFECIGTFN